MEESMKKHVSLVAALHIGYSIMLFIGAFVVFFALKFAFSMVSPGDETALTVIQFVGKVIPVMLFVFAIIGLIGAIGLLNYKKWGRILVLVISALDCTHIPLGTLLGVYSFWALMQDDTIKLFN
jgi:hypothetical protein